MQKRKKRRPILEKRKDGHYYENGKKLEDGEYIFHFNCQHGAAVISGLTGNKYFLK